MITINRTTDISINYDLSKKFPSKKICFFDIETTGLSRKTSIIYLIGLCHYENGQCCSTLFFNDDGVSERELLSELGKYISNFDIIINFNGDSFDIPFVLERAAINNISLSFENIVSFDMYKYLRKYKTFLNLPNLKQKSVELFLGINRDDMYDGGKLINVYNDYLLNKSNELYDLLILHNYEDVIGMVKLCNIFGYTDIFDGNFTFLSFKFDENNAIFRFTLQTPVIQPYSLKDDNFYLTATEDKLSFALKVKNMELKFFYPDYKNYYYLPVEDTAIHKSVAEFVDKNHRIKATKSNCYTKKTSLYCMQKKDVIKPLFRENCRDKISYFEIKDCIFNEKNSKELLLSFFK